jgi:hypothetical protein
MRRPLIGTVAAWLLGCGVAAAQAPEGEGARPCLPCAFVEAAYLRWTLKDAPLPILATRDGSNGAVPFNPGLFAPNAVVAVGGGPVDYGAFQGVRLGAGYFLDPTFAVEGRAFRLEHRDAVAAGASAGAPALFRPFVDESTGDPNGGVFLALPGARAGAVTVTAEAHLGGAEANLTGRLTHRPVFQCDVLAGVRFLTLTESVTVADQTLITPPNGLAGGPTFAGVPLALGDRLTGFDTFRVRNEFYGGQVGVRVGTQFGRLGLRAAAQLAFGATVASITIQGGSQLTRAAGGVITVPAGTLALPSNGGQFRHDHAALVPAVNLEATLDLGHGFRAWAGYDFLYWDNVARAGDQIDLTVQGQQQPQSALFGRGGAVLPPPPGRERATVGFWAQGFNAGLEWRY